MKHPSNKRARARGAPRTERAADSHAPGRPSEIVRAEAPARASGSWPRDDLASPVADAADQETRRLVGVLFEWIPTAISMRDLDDWRLIGRNAAALRLFGSSAQEELGPVMAHDINSELQPDGSPSIDVWVRLIERARQAGTSLGELWVKRGDGTFFLAEVRLSIVDFRGHRCLLTAIDDMTDGRRANAALRRRAERDALLARITRRFVDRDFDAALEGAITDLEGWTGRPAEGLATAAEGGDEDATMLRGIEELIVVARARHDAERSLARTADDASVANVTKSAFLARLSHDLRTQLSEVIGMVEALARTPLDPQQARYVHSARTSARMLLSAVEEIVDFSTIKAGRLRLTTTVFLVDEVVRDVVGTFLFSAEAKGLTLGHHVAPELARPVAGDRAKVAQILTNLVSNAIKFTAHGGVHVDASAWPGDGPIETVHFEVRDTGPGIPLESRETIFLPFTQLESAQDRGSGLGLAICRELVERMGGRIDVEARGEGGSTFSFELPLGRGDDRSPRDRPRRLDAPRGILGARRRSRVLIVEDSALIAEVVAEQLARSGYAFDIAPGGAAALEAMEARRYDLVLMDCQLPGLDGYETARRIRARERAGALARVPIVALTASAMPSDVARARQAGMDAHLAKPVGIEQLAEVVSSQLSGAAGAPGASTGARPPADLAIAVGRLRGSELLLRRIARRFVRTSAEDVATLRRAFATRDHEALVVAAHRLRGQAALFEANDLVGRATAVEHAAERLAWSEVEALVSSLSSAVADLLAFFVERGLVDHVTAQ